MKAISTRKEESPAILGEERRPAAAVTVTCSARLHLGFFDLEGGLGRRFGSIGLSLDHPVTRLTARRANTTQVTGSEQDRATRYLSQISTHLSIPNHHTIEIHQAMPPHAGL